MAARQPGGGADEVAALRRPFLLGVAVIVVAMAAIGIVIRQANAGNDRPEGTAERWLAAVGDTTRSGVAEDARDRAEELGGLVPAGPLLLSGGGDATGGKAAFPDLEVGRGTTTGDEARVPYRLHRRTGGGEELRQGTVLLRRVDGAWQVIGLDAARPGERVPSQGGELPSRAPAAAFAGAIVLGVLVTVACAGLIRWAGR